MSDGVHIKTCPLCEAMCGLEVTVEGGKVAKIRPRHEDVWSKGYICPKGTALGELHEDPDRLRRPLVRRGEDFEEVSWEEAFEEIERLLQPIVAEHGTEATTAYFGNPVAHNFSLSRYVAAFTPMANLPMVYSAGTVDQWPKNVSNALMFGGMWTFAIPDLDRTDYLVVLGANPHASQGSLVACADMLSRLDAIRERGGRVVVVDPRRTGTAKRADEWLPIRPGGDAALLMAWVHVLFEEGLVSLGALEGKVAGLEEVERLCRDFSPEAVTTRTGLEADQIRRIARELAAAERAAVYGRVGTCNQEFGTLASWLVDVVNVLTGNLDRVGGAMFSKPIAWALISLTPPEFADGFTFGRWKSRVRGAPEVLGQVPVSCLAEEISAPGKGQIKALFTIAGNPVLSAPGGDRLDRALGSLECMVSIDNYLNETSRRAHVVLPGYSVLEQPHYDEMQWSWAVRSAGKYSEPVFEPDPERPAEWEILLILAALIGGAKYREIDTDLYDDLFFQGLVAAVAEMPGSALEGSDPAAIIAAAEGRGPKRLVDMQIRTGPWGDRYGERPDGLTLAKLAAMPDGVDMGPMVPRVDEVLATPSRKVELAPEYITGDVARLRAALADGERGLVLVSRRHVRSNNSWMHNVPSLMTGRDRCTLIIHPDDASRAGLVDGADACVRSTAGELTVAVEVSEEMRPGVVSLPHGFGHDKAGARLDVASRHAGVCNNVLAPGDLVDPVSGNAVVNGIPVEVSLAEPAEASR